MGIRIRIDELERDLAQADEHWIISQIQQRRRDKGSVCVQIIINTSNLNMRLMSADCLRGGGGGRPPTPQEKEIFDLWERHGFQSGGIVGGRIVSFIKQLCRIV